MTKGHCGTARRLGVCFLFSSFRISSAVLLS